MGKKQKIALKRIKLRYIRFFKKTALRVLDGVKMS